MNYYVDVESEFKQAKSSLFRSSLLFSLLLTLVITCDILLVIFAKENYFLNYIIATIITVLFGWFAIFFFFNIFKDLNNKYRYYKNIESGIKEVNEVELLNKSNELSYVNGLYVYPIYVRYYEGIREEAKVIYSFTDKLGFENGDRLTISTYQRIILKADKH